MPFRWAADVEEISPISTRHPTSVVRTPRSELLPWKKNRILRTRRIVLPAAVTTIATFGLLTHRKHTSTLAACVKNFSRRSSYSGRDGRLERVAAAAVRGPMRGSGKGSRTPISEVKVRSPNR